MYFSFIGDIKCKKLDYTPNVGKSLYQINGSGWATEIFNCDHPKKVVIESRYWNDHEDGCSYYLANPSDIPANEQDDVFYPATGF